MPEKPEEKFAEIYVDARHDSAEFRIDGVAMPVDCISDNIRYEWSSDSPYARVTLTVYASTLTSISTDGIQTNLKDGMLTRTVAPPKEKQ